MIPLPVWMITFPILKIIFEPLGTFRKRKRLFTDTVSVNKMHLTDTVSVNKMHLTDTVSVNKVHLTDTVSLNKMYLTDTEPVNKDAPHRKIICV